METLVITWSPERSRCDALLLDRNGNRQGPVMRDAALETVATNQVRRVIWVVPGVHVTSFAATLPVRGREKVLRALPYALEERFAEDPERLFFSLAVGLSGARVQAAAAEREWFQAGISALGRHGLRPAHAIPDYLALPWRPGTWTVLADAGMLYVRQAEGLGFTLEADAGWSVLKRRLAVTAEDERPQSIRYLRGREPFGAEPELELLTPESASRAEGLLGLLPQALTGDGFALDLIRGAFGESTSWRTLLRPWRPAVAALAAVLMLAITGFAAGWVQSAHADAALLRTIRTRFHQLLPGAPWIDESTARAQLRQRLQRSAASGTGHDQLLSLLDAVAGAADSKVELESLSYRAGTLQLQIHAPTVSVLDQFRAAVSRRGVGATLRAANQTRSGVEGALVISAGGTR